MNTRISATPSIRHAAGLVVVRSAGVMGKGIFAMRDIARGTRILDEDPLFVVYDRPLHDDRTEEAFIQDVETFCETARNLSANKLQKLDRLYYDAGYDKTSDKDRIKDWYLDEGIRDEQGRQMSEKNLIYAVMEMSRRYTIFKDSCAQVGLDGTGQDSAIFLLYSRINHSCSPNAHAHYNGTTERLTVHATRDIEAGDQIFVPYVDTACLPRDRRQELTKRFGFACECPTCTIDLAAEPLRQRMHELQRGFRRFVKKRPAGVVPMPTTPGQALRDIEEFIGILKDPSINLQNATLRNASVLLSRKPPPPSSTG